MTPPTGTGTPRTDAFAETMLGSPLEDGSGKRPVHPRAYREALKFCATLETELATERARRESAEGALREVIPLGNDWEHTKFWEAHRKACAHFQQYGEGSGNGG